jgi:hypothetical protein
MNNPSHKNNLQHSYRFSYNSVYEEIYDSSYGTGFVFVEEDETFTDDIDFDSSISPLAPSGFCRSRYIGLA